MVRSIRITFSIAIMIAIASLPLPDPPLLRMEENTGKITSQFPKEIMVFLASAKRGVGQGMNMF
jgi:hypothetical protein